MFAVTDHYAVFGNPIAHSKSPEIHAAFARQTEQSLRYTAECPPIDGFPAAVTAFFERGGRGCNITVPFKLEAANIADDISELAQRGGAINTLIKTDDNRIRGHNTDGVGLVRDLQSRQGVVLEGKRVLIIGAGGAVRGVLQPLLNANPQSILVANRTGAKATSLAARFADLGNIAGCGLDDIDSAPFDLIINGTSTGLDGDVPAVPAACVRNAHCYDMFYGSQDTAFVTWCKRQGAAHATDGLGMLLEQAAESFSLWRGVRPEVDPVLESIRAATRAAASH